MRWLELIKDYDCTFHNLPSQADMVIDAFSLTKVG